MTDYTLLTGATGLLGRYLLRDLLLAGQRVVVVVRPSKRQSVAERVESLLQMWEAQLGQELPRPVCLEGDLSQEHLGLDESARQWLAENCSRIIHSAAALKFQEEADGEPWQTNVEGTRHVLQLCRDAGVKKMHYVSTAYVSGSREGRIYESELDLGQGFRNDYEASKLQAETLVRQDAFLDELTVYRPAVIAGDSQTGYTNTYHGLFMYLQLMSVLARNTEPGPDGVRQTSLELHITGDEPRNVIPVDWTSAVICHLFKTPAAHGKTFHLAPHKRMTARDMIEAGYTYYNSAGVEFVGPIAEESGPSEGMGSDAYENSGMYRAYESSDPLFDTTNLEEYAGHLPCPEIDESMLHRFMKYGEEDRWGKRRTPAASVPCWVESYLEGMLEQQGELSSYGRLEEEQTLGIDALGPGGGQWTLVFSEGQLISFAAGIDSDCQQQIQLSASLFSECEKLQDANVPTAATEQKPDWPAELVQLFGRKLANVTDPC